MGGNKIEIVVTCQYLQAKTLSRPVLVSVPRERKHENREGKERKIERETSSNKIRKQQRNRNQRRLRDPQNNSGIRPLPSRESLTQAKGPQDYPALNRSSLFSFPFLQRNAG